MNCRIILSWVTLVFFGVYQMGQTQILSPLETIIQEAKTKGQKFVIVNPFIPIISQDFANFSNIANAKLFDVDKPTLSAISNSKPKYVELNLELNSGEQLDILLESQQLFDASSRLLTTDEKSGDPLTGGAYYRGIINGVSGSFAAISFFDDQVIGVLSTPLHGNIILGKTINMNKESESIHALYLENELPIRSPFKCGVLENAETFLNLNQPSQAPSTISPNKCRTVKVFLECDYRMYLDKNGQVNQVTAYITGLFNVVKALYFNESINLEISDIKVWTTQDPFLHTNLSDILYNYAGYRNSNFNGNLAQLVTTQAPQQQGGIAFVNGLCNPWNGNIGPLSFAFIYNNYSQLPTYSWSVEVMTHEMGHNFGSWHTHSCVWGPFKNMQLDNCQTPDIGSCSPGPTPVGGGTIMSYCHLTGIGINFSKGFGQEPGDLLRNAVNTKPCLVSSFVASQKISVGGPYYLGDTIKLIAKPYKSTYTYDWFHYDYRIPGKNDTFLDIKYSGIFTAAISNKCSEYADPDTITLNDFQVNLGCPVIAGKKDSIVYQIALNVDNSESSDSLTFPSNLYNTIPSNAKDILVEYQTTIAPKGTSWLRSVKSSIISPASIDISLVDFQPNKEEPFPLRTPTSYSKILGKFDPAGKWLFNSIDDRVDSGIDAVVTHKIVLKWRLPDSVIVCDIPLCEGSAKTFDAGISNAKYVWSNGLKTKSISVNKPGPLTLTVTKGNQTSSHSIQLVNKKVNFQQNYILCQGDTVVVGNNKYFTAGIFENKLIASDGCDSIINISIELKPTITTTSQLHICYGDTINSIPIYQDTTLKLVYHNIIAGCDSIALLTVKVNPRIILELSANPACSNVGGKIESNSSGGTGQKFLYQWSNGDTSAIIDHVNSGIYTLTIMDSLACTVTKSINLNNFDSIAIQAQVSHVKCFGDKNGKIEIDITSGSAPFLTNWNTGIPTKDLYNLDPGKYNIFISDANGCLFQKEFEITSPDVLFGTIDSKSSSGSNGSAKVNVFGGIPPYRFKWNTNDTINEINGLTPGEYQVTITDENGCTNVQTITILETVGVKDPNKNYRLHIQPNPVMKQLTIQSEDLKIRKITLYSLLGSEVFNISNNKQQDLILKVDMDKLKPGQYILKIIFEDGSILHKQILKL